MLGGYYHIAYGEMIFYIKKTTTIGIKTTTNGIKTSARVVNVRKYISTMLNKNMHNNK